MQPMSVGDAEKEVYAENSRPAVVKDGLNDRVNSQTRSWR